MHRYTKSYLMLKPGKHQDGGGLVGVGYVTGREVAQVGGMIRWWIHGCLLYYSIRTSILSNHHMLHGNFKPLPLSTVVIIIKDNENS